MSKFPASDGPAPKLELCRNFLLTKSPPPPRVTEQEGTYGATDESSSCMLIGGCLHPHTVATDSNPPGFARPPP